MTDITTVDVDSKLEFTAGRRYPDSLDLDGFNSHGVRENRDDGDLQSVDVIYEAMEPGPPEDRNGVRITEDFLRSVAEKEYSGTEPYMLGHSDQPLDEIGKLREIWFSDSAGKLMVMNRVFNTGAQTHDEVISRLTHDPPTMTDGSIGFGSNYEAAVNGDEEPELIDGKIREFSTVPFPGGYDDGGVGLPSAAFAEEVLETAEANADDGDDDALENFASDADFSYDSLDEVYEAYQSAINMSDEELTEWDRHPCADAGSNNHKDIRTKNLMLLGTPREGWKDSYIDPATETIEFINRMKDERPERPSDGGPGTCPSPWAIQLMNRAFNPLDGMPRGVPSPETDYAEVETFEVDDKPEETSDVEDGFENSEVAVFTEQFSI